MQTKVSFSSAFCIVLVFFKVSIAAPLFAQSPNPFDGNAIFEMLGQHTGSAKMQQLKKYLSEDSETKFTESIWFSREKGLEIGIDDGKVERVFMHGRSPYNYGTQPFKGNYLLGITYDNTETQIISQLGQPHKKGSSGELLYYVKHGEVVYYVGIDMNEDGKSVKHTHIKLDENNNKPTLNSQYHTSGSANATTGQPSAAPLQASQTGCVSGNCYEGMSTYVWESGSKYIGEYSKGKREGFGSYFFSNGDQFTGEWRDNQRHGTGMYIYATEGRYKKYLGEWYDGKRSGIGLMEYRDGSKKLGEWEENEPIDSDGQKGCLAGDCQNTYSDYIWEDGSRYIGNFRASKPHGKGTMYFENGSKYTGGFRDGTAHGRGILHATDGSKYEGEWVNGLKDGFGTLYHPNGEVETGEWKDGNLLP